MRAVEKLPLFISKGDELYLSKFDGLLGNATFSRYSSAYSLDGITSVANNVPRYEIGRFQNLVTNSGFESGMWSEEWNPFGTASLVSGWNDSTKKAMRITLTGATVGNNYGRVSNRTMRLESGKTYVISFMARANRNGVALNYLYLMNSDTVNTGGNTSISSNVGPFYNKSVTTTWARYYGAYTIPTGKTSSQYGLMLAIINTGSTVVENDWIEFDDVQVEEAFSKDGSNNWIPTDWRETPRGILIEESTTNLTRNSDFEVMAGAKQRVFFDDFNRVPTLTFTRSSVANDPITGSSISSGAARYVSGRFQNLLTKNQSDLENISVGTLSADNIISAGAGLSTFAVETTDRWQGNNSLKVTTGSPLSGGYGGVGFILSNPAILKPGVTYILSAYVKGSGATVRFFLWQQSPSTILGTATTKVLDNTWQRITQVVYVPNPLPNSGIGIRIDCGTDSTSFWVDGVQLEEAIPQSSTTPTNWRAGGSGMGVFIEEGTANLIAGKTDFSTSTWTAYSGATVTRTAGQSDPYGGTNAIRLQTSGGTNNLKYYVGSSTATVGGASYTNSVWIKVPSGVPNVKVADNFGAIQTVVAGSGWTKVIITSSNVSSAISTQFRFETITSTDSLDFYVMQPQIEQKAYATSFIDGTRNAETLTVPTTGISVSAGTWEQWFYSNSSIKKQITSNWPTLFNITGTVNNTGIWLYHEHNSTSWSLQTKNDAGAISANPVFTDTDVPDGWHLASVSWSGTTLKVYVDGVLKSTITGANMPSTFGATAAIGYNAQYGNTYHDSIRASNVERTQTEITAYYNATSPLLDDKTVFLLNFDNDLSAEATVQAGWNVVRGYTNHGWSIKNNKLYQGTNQGNYYWDNQLSNGDAEWTDVDISVKITLIGGTSAMAAGLIIRSNNVADNNLNILMNRTSLVINKRVSGTQTVVTSISAQTFNLNQEYTMRAVITGTSGTVYIDGVQKLTFTIPNDVPTQGKIAAYAYYAEATFDDIEVKADIADGWTYNTSPTHTVASATNNGSKVFKIGYNGGTNTDKYLEQTYVVAPNKPYTVSYQMNATSGKTPKVRWADSNGNSLNENVVTVANNYWNSYSHTFTIPNIATTTLDFNGKVSGSLTPNPHKATRGYYSGSTPSVPASYSMEEGQNAYNSLMVQDNNCDSSAGTSFVGHSSAYLYTFDILTALKNAGRIPQSWDVATLKANISSFSVVWYGFGVGSNAGVQTYAARLECWNSTTSSWVTNTSTASFNNTTSTATAINFTNTSLTVPANLVQYIDSNGLLYLLAHSTYPADATIVSGINADYVKLDVTLSNVALNLRWYPLDTTTIYLDKVQLEQLAYPTSYQRNDDLVNSYTRALETLTIPTGSLTPNAGTLEMWVYVTDVVKRQNAASWTEIFHIPRSTSNGSNIGIRAFHSAVGAFWGLQVRDDNNNPWTDQSSAPDSATPNGWHLFTVTWNASAIKMYIDGALKTTIIGHTLPSGFASQIYIGQFSSTAVLDGIVDDVRISSIVRSDADILATFNATKGNYSDYATIAYCDLDNDLYSQKDVKAVLTAAGNLHIRGLKQIG